MEANCEAIGGVNILENCTLQNSKKLKFKGADVFLAATMLAVGLLYWNLMSSGLIAYLFLNPITAGALGLGTTVFAGIICGITLIYFKVYGIRQTKKSLPWLSLVFISALQFAIFAGSAEKLFNFCFLVGVFVYWVCVSTGRRLDEKLSIYLIGDAVNQALVVPFSNFRCLFLSLKEALLNHRSGKVVFSAIAGIVIFLPMLVLVINLLTEADMAFETLIFSILDGISLWTLIPYVIQFLLGIPVAFYIYGLLYGNASGHNTEKIRKTSMDGFAKKISFAPRSALYAVMTAFILVYALFFLAQASYLFSAFSSRLPEAMTYAEYARQGFFELCAVVGINLALMSVAHIFIQKRKDSKLEAPKTLRIQTVILCVFTILLIITAVSKMFLYVETYGLTHLRIYTTWFMVLLFFVFLAVGARQVKKFNGTKVITIGFIVFFLILCYGNVDAAVGKYNVERYEAGTLAFMDDKTLTRLSDGAVPYLYNLYLDTEDEVVKRAIYEKLTGERAGDLMPLLTGQPSQQGFRVFNIQTHNAEEIKNLITVSP